MGKQLRTEMMTINMGPQHPSTHGVIRFIITTDGEIVHHCEPDVGYLHRSIEKIGEQMTWHAFVPFTDRVDYVAAMNANWAYCLAVETMIGTEVPRRGEFLRVIVGELNRVSSHLIAIGAMAMDLGGFTPFIQLLREREYINDLLEMACGARLTYNYLCIGGVHYDVPRNWTAKIEEFLTHFDLAMEQMNRLISYNRIFINRMASIAVVSREQAIGYNLVGPNLRGSGVQFDLRRDHPYSVYRELEFEVPYGQGREGQVGDCYDRYYVRVEEVRESVKIIRQAIKMMPEGLVKAKVKNSIRPPEGVIHSKTETPRGETGYLIESNKKNTAYRIKIRTGSFTAMSLVPEIAPGLFIADLIALIGSLDVVAPELDR